jgi:pimeloyl-ACP methyl ester carboxylesterase
MSEPRLGRLEILDPLSKAQPARGLAYYEWGAPDNPRIALCVHGMSRNAHDFDDLAEGLELTHRVIALDCPGRGKSDWLADKSAYQLATYLADCERLFDHLGIETVDWIGTSMGGLMGITLAGSRRLNERARIRRLVLNDIGPFLPGAAMDRIGGYVGRAPRFPDLEAAYTYQAGVNADWASLSESQRRRLAQHSVRPVDGGFAVHYDPAIAATLHGGPVPDLALWSFWDALACPTLVLRGSRSDILLAETANDMTHRGPRAIVIEIPDVGHTPSLMTAQQITVVRDFLTD